MDMPDALQIFIDKVSKANYTKVEKPSSRNFGYQPRWREIHIRKTISYVEFSHNPNVSSFRLETFKNTREIYHDIGDAYYKSPDRPMDIVSEHVAYYQTGYYFDAAAFLPLLEQLRAKGAVDIDLEGVYYQIDSERSSHQGMSKRDMSRVGSGCSWMMVPLPSTNLATPRKKTRKRLTIGQTMREQ